MKPFSTISVPSMKILGGHDPSLSPAADAHGQRGGGLIQCGHFADKGGQFFAILCGRLLCTAPYFLNRMQHTW